MTKLLTGAPRTPETHALYHGRRGLRLLSEYLIIDSPVQPSDLIFVLAGMPERKQFGLDLFRRGFAERIILSVGRYEVRQTASIIKAGNELQALARSTTPRRRHFFVDCERDTCHITVAAPAGWGTYAELFALADYLVSQPLLSLTLISTSIHLRRVRYCCRRIRFFADKTISYVPVPEPMSSFQRTRWWTLYRNWRYVIMEYCKLAGYALRYRGGPDSSVAHQLPRD